MEILLFLYIGYATKKETEWIGGWMDNFVNLLNKLIS